MKRNLIRTAVVCAVLCSFSLTSCIGSFPLFNKLRTWNENVGAKGVNELVFLAFWVLPVYEVAALADLVVLNSIEFWGGDNPVAKGTKKIETENGTYLVKCDGKGYDIIDYNGRNVRLDFCVEENTWSVIVPETGEEYFLFGWVDADHVKMPLPSGQTVTVEVSQAGYMAYMQSVGSTQLAMRD